MHSHPWAYQLLPFARVVSLACVRLADSQFHLCRVPKARFFCRFSAKQRLGVIVTTETDRLIRLPEVLHLCGISRSALYELVSRNEFPQPVRIGARSVGWRQRDVHGWIESRPPALGFLGRNAMEESDE